MHFDSDDSSHSSSSSDNDEFKEEQLFVECMADSSQGSSHDFSSSSVDSDEKRYNTEHLEIKGWQIQVKKASRDGMKLYTKLGLLWHSIWYLEK